MKLREFLFPQAAERDPGFRREIQRLSVRSLYIIASVCIGMPVLGFVFHQVAQIFEAHPGHRGLWGILLFVLLAAILVALAKTSWGRRHARLMALLSGVVATVIGTWNIFLEGSQNSHEAGVASLMHVMVVLLIGVAAIPALPMQMFFLGLAIGMSHWISSTLAEHWDLIPPISLHNYAGLDLVVLLCTGLSAVNYHRILETYRSYQSNMEAQSHLLLSETAALMGRFAATLSHELNTPLGVIKSSLDSIKGLKARSSSKSPLQPDHLKQVESDLIESAKGSVKSLESVIGRMQRFTNLDRAEVVPVNLAVLLDDVISMSEPETRDRVAVQLQCDQVPPLRARPQQMSAVFSTLLHNAAGDHEKDVQVSIDVRCINSIVEVAIQDNGPGLSSEDLAGLFSPRFQVKEGKVTADWSLFHTRQIVREHGGEIQVQSTPGQGTQVLVTLPCYGALTA